MVGAILAHIDFLDEQIGLLSDAIAEKIAPFEKAVELLCTIPGVQRRTAEVMIAEIGTDMSVFPTAGHLASWAGLCPGNDKSAGKRRSGTTRHGSKWLQIALNESAHANIRSKDTYLSAQYRRMKPRRGHRKAIGAVRHSIIVSAWHMLSTGERSTARPAATTSPASTPTSTPGASSPSSNASDTPSRCKRLPLDQTLISHQGKLT